MKTIIIFTFLLLSFPAFSQENSFGLKAGYVNSWVNSSEFSSSLDYSKRNGFSIGFLYNRELSKAFSFQSEVLYTQKGYSYTFSDSSGSVTFDNYTDYVEIPLLLKARLEGKVTPYLNAGVAPAFNVRDSYNTSKSFDLGLIGSLGFDFKISEKTKLFIELRVNTGLLKAQSNHTQGSFYAFTGIVF